LQFELMSMLRTALMYVSVHIDHCSVPSRGIRGLQAEHVSKVVSGPK